MGYMPSNIVAIRQLPHNSLISPPRCKFSDRTYGIVMSQPIEFQHKDEYITHNHNNSKHMNFLDTKISIYDSVYDNIGRIGTMRDFLQLGLDHKEYIDRLRQTDDTDMRKKMKIQLPCATISGTFSKRDGGKLINHSGYIALDLDDVADCSGLIAKLADMDIVAYVGRSVGGRGVYAIVPIAYPHKHRQQWEALRRYLATHDIKVDIATKDVTRLRFCSYDIEARLRDNAVPYTGVYETPRYNPVRSCRYEGTDKTEAKVADCCRQIAACHIDLTNDYADWLKLGFSLSELGESGRTYFHVVSSQCRKYKQGQCDRKYDDCLRSRRTCGIGYFFNRCKEYGITSNINSYE